MKNIFVIIFCCLAGLSMKAQRDFIVNKLSEVTVLSVDKNSKENSVGFKIIRLKDSVIENNRESFTSLIRFSAPIYLREYGSGGTSTARFRGTSSSNTAVIWNGININSINNGLTGFNSLSVNLIDNIDIRAGGGSIKYGSGAIGGTIHLNTNLVYKDHFKNQFITSVGSYSSYQNLFKTSYGNSNFALKAGVTYNQSDNDYPLLGTRFKNTNGAYDNLNWNISSAFRVSAFSNLKLYLTKYKATRLFSGELPNPTTAREKYQDFNQRSLLVFENHYNEYSHILKIAYLTEQYNYFADKDISNFDFGKSNTWLFNYDFSYNFGENTKIDSYTEYTSIKGSTNKLTPRNRTQFSQAIIFSQKIEHLFSYNLKIRQDFNSDYDVPFVMAIGAEIPLNNKLNIRLNVSKNYRVPSYNDLYWPGQGNPNLFPETSKQGEIGLSYKTKNTTIDFAYFYIRSKDKIVWDPNGDPERPGIWVPINIAETKNSGIELHITRSYSIGNNFFNFNGNYSYTLAKDNKTNQFLIFVPKHIANFNIGYSYKRWSSFYQFLFNGQLYTSEDNISSNSMPSYDLSNIGIDYKVIKTKNQNLTLGIKVNNLYNKIYQISPRRPMPNRNFNIHINYKF
jgi:iron complex outermembrane receptor protein